MRDCNSWRAISGKALDTLNQAGELENAGAEIPFRMAVSYYYQGLWPSRESCEEAIGTAGRCCGLLIAGGAKFRLNDLPGAEKAFCAPSRRSLTSNIFASRWRWLNTMAGVCGEHSAVGPGARPQPAVGQSPLLPGACIFKAR